MQGGPDLLERAAAVLDARPARLSLALLVLVSLLPLPIEERLRPLFLLVFGGELLLRLLLHRRLPQATNADRLFLLIDVAAFVSFLPLQGWLGAQAQVLTLLRLTRLLLLLRISRDLARDVYLILTRREQLQQFSLVTGFVAALSFVSTVVLVQLRVSYSFDGDGRRPAEFWPSLWWSFRQLESADNLVPTLRGPLLVTLLSLLLTITGVFVISFLIGIGSNVVEQVMRAERRRPVGYRGHSLVIGPVDKSGDLVREFVTLYDKHRQLRRLRPREIWDWLVRGGPRPRRHALPRMVLLGPADDPPDYLYQELMRWVVYRQGHGADPEALERVGGRSAKRVILLADSPSEPDADAVTIATLAALRAQNREGHVFVEVLDSQNRQLVQEVGGRGTFPLDLPRFAGLFLCQHLVVPGVELLYQELLRDEGSEFYTHVMVDPRESTALRRHAPPVLAFEEMARRAYARYGVVLTGVYLGQGEVRGAPSNLVPVDRLAQWINPLAAPHPEAAALGAEPGRVPTAHLRGLIGVCSTYRPLRRYCRALAGGRGLQGGAPGDEALRALLHDSQLDTGGLKRLVLVGFSPALPALIAELARFLDDPEVLLIIGSRGDEQPPLQERLSQLGIDLNLDGSGSPGAGGVRAALSGGGNVTVWTHQGANLADFAVRCLAKEAPVDAAVFLSEPSAADRDARTGMRVLRFAQALRDGKVPRGRRLHLMAEFGSRSKGERIQQQLLAHRCGLRPEEELRVTLVSTDQIKSYFMVRSAFVPGVTALYEEILAKEGQALCRLQPPAALRQHPGALGLSEVREALLPRGYVPIGLELDLPDGRLRLNPEPQQRFPAAALRGVYVIAGL